MTDNFRRSDRTSPLVRWGVALAASSYVGYLALLVTCDVLRVAPLGFLPQFDAATVVVADLKPDSIAARAGLRAGDRVRRANGQVLEGHTDWKRVRAHLDPSKPLELEIERADRSFTAHLVLPSGLSEWRSGPRPGLMAFRLAQVITLGFALIVAFKRYFQLSALVGALLLASMATVSVVLLMRMAAFWHALAEPLSLLLWLPLATSAAVGSLLFAFFAMFPRRVLSTGKLCMALLPGAFIMALHLYSWYHILRHVGPPTGVPDRMMAIYGVNIGYAVLTVGLLLVHQRAAETLTDKRRIRVLIVGAVVGAAAGAAVAAGYWRNPGKDIFASPTMTALSLVFLAMPASFAHAILRHRLFDIRLIVRQGIRYALARRFIDALIPLLAAVLLVDVIVHRTQPLVEILRSRWWWFALVGGALLIARGRREQWLRSVDRRFFRERYDARRLLGSIAEQIARASSFDDIAPSILLQIEQALHPEFVSVLRHARGASAFETVASGSTAEHASGPLPASLAVIGVLSVLRRPLALSRGDTAWVRHQLPIEERALLIEQGIELLVPICTERSGDPPRGLLALGLRRSEEPYNKEDLDLLSTIAYALGLLLERSLGDRHMLGECDTCGRCFDGTVETCPDDHLPLTMVAGSLLLNERYRLERRLGRGGMGVVYAAVDAVLERPVAVKLIRDDGVGPLDLAARFREEARTAAGFAHPHVVRVYDFGVDRFRRPFLVMELLEGETLRQRLVSGGPLSASDALQILRGVCTALSAAHARGLIHRDLKPENIFLQRHATGVIPKVLDFGLAKAFDERWPLERSTGAASSAGLLVGTLEYMSPEQVAGDDVNPAWDVWALAVTAYEMLTGNHPSRRTGTLGDGQTDTGTTVAAVVAGKPLTEARARFFRTALSTDRALRPADALEFLDAYEKVLA